MDVIGRLDTTRVVQTFQKNKMTPEDILRMYSFLDVLDVRMDFSSQTFLKYELKVRGSKKKFGKIKRNGKFR